jgi:hypothetical protein
MFDVQKMLYSAVQAREKSASQLCADRISVPSGYVFSRSSFLTICTFFALGKYLPKIEKFLLGALSAHFTSIIKKGASFLISQDFFGIDSEKIMKRKISPQGR